MYQYIELSLYLLISLQVRFFIKILFCSCEISHHINTFIQGVFLRSHTCPMCRTPIPEDYLDNPQLLKEIPDKETEYVNNKYWWYYEGQDGK